jgi:hypothetical protein
VGQVAPALDGTGFGVGRVTTTAGERLVLQLHTPFGVTFVQFVPEAAERLAEQLQAMAKQVRSGLVVAGKVP